MNVDFTPDVQTLVQQAIESGRLSRAEDAVQKALSLWAVRERERIEKCGIELKKAQDAAASIRELRKGVTLGGLKIKDLVAEGRR